MLELWQDIDAKKITPQCAVMQLLRVHHTAYTTSSARSSDSNDVYHRSMYTIVKLVLNLQTMKDRVMDGDSASDCLTIGSAGGLDSGLSCWCC